MPTLSVCVICGEDVDASLGSDYCWQCSAPAKRWRCQECGRWFDADIPGQEPARCVDCSH